MRKLIVAALMAVAFPTAASAQDLENGKTVFNKCRTCHQVGETARNAIGPVLNGLIGRKAGTIPGYVYSEANKTSGLTWDEATFKSYIKDPKAKIPGTKMAFPGLTEQADINDIWAYILQFDAEGKVKAK
jgi:cytochrome c